MVPFCHKSIYLLSSPLLPVQPHFLWGFSPSVSVPFALKESSETLKGDELKVLQSL